MPVYQFRASDGAVIERVHAMRDAPPLGSVIWDDDGKQFARVVSTPRLDVDRPVVSHAAPQWSGERLGLDHTADGKVIFKNKGEKRDYLRANPQYVNARD